MLLLLLLSSTSLYPSIPLYLSQDDSPLNRKVIMNLIESEKKGPLQNARLLEADDGTSAVETLRRELSEGRQVDFVLLDYVMVMEFKAIAIWYCMVWWYSNGGRCFFRFACTARRRRASCATT